jgi:hypothetical protein
VPRQPTPNTVTFDGWYVDGNLVATDVQFFFFNGSAYGSGSHTVTARATDNSSLVLNDPNELLVTEVTWQVDVESTGGGPTVPPIAIVPEVDREFALGQNIPNPFNPVTTINYYLPEEGAVVLAVYDVHGKRIRTLASGLESAGEKSVTWDGTNDAGLQVGSGIYFYRLHAGSETSVRKMLLMK